LSQSLADLFASGTVNKTPRKPQPAETGLMLQDTTLAYPTAESISDVVPPDEGKALLEP
jgi:hypothetical protein